MKFAYGNRASSVLYNWLVTNNISGKVLIPANICESVPSTYLKAGIDIVFCDISLDTLQIDSKILFESLNENQDISIVHFNHTYGCRKQLDEDVIKKLRICFPELILIEDCCLSIPKISGYTTEYDLSLFSTGHTKVINIGKGGFAYYQDKWFYNETPLRYHIEDVERFDKKVKECHKNINSFDISVMTSDWLNTECTFNKMTYISEIRDNYLCSIEHKELINSIYNRYLRSFSLGNDFQDWRYNILVNNQDYCMQKLFENGLFASKHYKSLGSGYFVREEYPNCDWLEDHVINLFNDNCYSAEQAEKTGQLLKKIAETVV